MYKCIFVLQSFNHLSFMETATRELKQHHVLANHFRTSGLLMPGMSMNELLVETYKAQTGAKFFRTFNQWKQAGYSIIKGSKGFPVFSRPIGTIKEEKGHNDINPDLYKVFGTCYLFNELQVSKK